MDFVIVDYHDDERMLWSNSLGWTEFWGEATVFSVREMGVFNLPIGNNPQWIDVDWRVCGDCGEEYSMLDICEETAFADHGKCWDCAHGW